MGERGSTKIGDAFGRLTVIKEIGKKRGAILFLCKCECGNEKEITGCDIRTGKVKSCGCLKKEMRIKENTTHGLKNHRIYGIYHNMVSRCYNSNVLQYSDYGGRGITICPEWIDTKNGFLNFYKWSIDNGYSSELTIDRINVNGDYSPENCRWVNMQVQSNNRRNNHLIEINGEIKTLREWSDVFGISQHTVQCRIQRGWETTTALTTPINDKYINRRYLK